MGNANDTGLTECRDLAAALRSYGHDAGTHPTYHIGRRRISRSVLAGALRRLEREDPPAHALLVAAFCGRPAPFGYCFPAEVDAALGSLLGLVLSE